MDKRIANLRNQIDDIDEKILLLLDERMDLAEKIGRLKEKLHISALDQSREEEIIKRFASSLKDRIPEGQIKKIFSVIFEVSRQAQQGNLQNPDQAIDPHKDE